MKVTCSSGKVREKLDVLGKRHDQDVLDFKKTVSEAHQLVIEKDARVTMLKDACGAVGHICTETCAQQNVNAKEELNQARKKSNSGIAIIFDNIDGKLERRHMGKENQNLNRVSSKLDNSPRELLL